MYTSPWVKLELTTLALITLPQYQEHDSAEHIWRAFPMNTIIRQARHYFRFSLLIRICRPPYWLLVLVSRIIGHNEVPQSFWTKNVAGLLFEQFVLAGNAMFLTFFFSYSDAWKIKSKSLFTSRLIFDTDRLIGDHSPNFFRQTSLLFHKWFAERFNLDDAWIVNVRYKNTSIDNALITWIGKFCTFRSQTKLFSRLFLVL
jgi:hypothetical protein